MTAFVSIIMPTYNRADTVMRSVKSVMAQSFEDWELIIVDDGSTDATLDVLANVDPRIRVIPKAHEGVAATRNRGLRPRGPRRSHRLPRLRRRVARLSPRARDGLLRRASGGHLYSSEFWEDFGRGLILRHFWAEIAEWYPATAAKIGARGLAGPPPRGDGYLRVYESRAEIGEWGRDLVERSWGIEVSSTIEAASFRAGVGAG